MRKGRFMNTLYVVDDHLVRVFKAFLLKKRVKPLRTLDEAIEDFIIANYP